MKQVKKTVVLGLIVLLLTAVTAQAAWYKGRIINVTPVAGGNVTVRFMPGTGETKFAGEGKAYIDPYAIGSKNMLATILTAVSLNKEVTMELGAVPSSQNQTMTAVSLTIE